MNLFQFLRILWAHRYVTLATTLFTVFGAFIAILIVPPRYEGVSRVMLEILKPDPVTGEVIPNVSTRLFLATQSELIKDYGVAGTAVDELNWASNPDVITMYQTSNTNGMDIRRWLAKRVIDSTKVEVVTGTNILEISYRATTPAEARGMADALRNAYIESTLNTRRREATRNAEWYEVEARKELALLNAADAAKTAYEREHGIVMGSDNTDMESARLQALATQSAAPQMIAPAVPMVSPTAAQLSQLDAAIAQSSRNLGPNHPQMVQLRAQRASLAQVVAQEANAARAAAGAAASAANASASAVQREVATQTTKVIEKRDKIERLTQLQAELNVRREQYNKSIARIAELRQQAAVADVGITSLGEAVTPQKPKFPNKPLILGGALGLGFAMGILLSLLLELFGRRIRSIEDLKSCIDAPLLAIIDGPPEARKRRGGFLMFPKFSAFKKGRRPASDGKLAEA